MNESKPLGPADVARLIGVTAMTVRRISDKGELSFTVTPGGHRRYQMEDIVNYCQQKGIEMQNTALRQRVLIVDDDEQVAMMLKAFIESVSIPVETEVALGGFEAGLKIRSFLPGVIISDILMPDINGITLCETLKKDPSTEHIRVIGISGTTNEKDIEQFLAAGAETCLRKPVKRQELLAALNLFEGK